MVAPLTESSAVNVSRDPVAGGVYGSLQLVSDAGEVKHTYAIRKPRIVFGRCVFPAARPKADECRDPDSDVRLLLKEVSRRHCELVFEQPRSVCGPDLCVSRADPPQAVLWVNGANGVLYNGVHVQPKARVMLSEGDKVQIAKHRLQFYYSGNKVSAAVPVHASPRVQTGEIAPVEGLPIGPSTSPPAPRKEAQPAELPSQPEEPAAAPVQDAANTEPEEPADDELPADEPSAPARDDLVRADKTPVVQPVSPLPRPSPTSPMPASDLNQSSPEDADEDAEDEESIITLCLGDSEAAVQREAVANAAPPTTSQTTPPSQLGPAAASPLGMPRTPPMFSPKTRRLSLRTATLLKSGSKFPLVPMSESRNRHRAMHWSPSPTVDRGNTAAELPTAPEREAINIDDASDEDDEDELEVDESLEIPSPTPEAQDHKAEMPTPLIRKLPSIGFLTPQGKRKQTQQRRLSDYSSGSQMPEPQLKHRSSWSWLSGFFTNLSPQRSPKAPTEKEMDVDNNKAEQAREDVDMAGEQALAVASETSSGLSAAAPIEAHVEHTEEAMEPAGPEPAETVEAAEAEATKPTEPAGAEPAGAEPAGAEPAEAEPAEAEPAEAEPAEAEPAEAEPAEAEPAEAEPAGAEPAEAEPAGAEPAGAEPAGAEPAEAEPMEPDAVQDATDAQPAEHADEVPTEEGFTEASDAGAPESLKPVAQDPADEVPEPPSQKTEALHVDPTDSVNEAPSAVSDEANNAEASEHDASTSLAAHDAAAAEPESHGAMPPATPAKELPTSNAAPAAPVPEGPTPDLRSLKHMFAEPKQVSGQEEVMADFRHILRQHDAAQTDAADTSVGGALQSMMATPAKPAGQPAARLMSVSKTTADENVGPSAPSAGTAISAGVRRSTRTLRSPTSDALPARGAGMRAGVRRTEPFVPTRRHLPPRAAAPLRADLAASTRPKAEHTAEPASRSTEASSGTRRTATRSEQPRRTTRASAARRP